MLLLFLATLAISSKPTGAKGAQVGDLRMTTELRKSVLWSIREGAFAFMSLHRSSSSATDLIGKILFPGVRGSRRRTNLRFLMLSVLLGSVVCSCLGLVLWLMN